MEYLRALLAVLTELVHYFGRWSLSATEQGLLPAASQLSSGLSPTLMTEEPVVRKPAMALNFDTERMVRSVAWVCVREALVFLQPLIALDTVRARLSYATEVVLIRYQGRFAAIECGDVSGWVSKDALAFESGALFPVLVSGEVYGAHHEDTERIRLYLDDQFAAAELLLPLLPEEYVTYRLARGGSRISWPYIRPRLPGQWHRLLSGVRGVEIGVVPRTGAMYECKGERGGYVAVVEAVHPDGSMVIAGVGRGEEGRFLREEYTKDRYRGEEGVFMVVT